MTPQESGTQPTRARPRRKGLAQPKAAQTAVAAQTAAVATPSAPSRRPRTSQAPQTARISVPAKALNARNAPAITEAKPKRPRRSALARVDRPAVALCADLDTLRALTAEEAHAHVARYLRDVMPREDAEAFEAHLYRWELHLIELDQLRLVRGVDLVPSRVRRYRAAINKGAAFPPLIGLGGDGPQPTEDVLLCDGYHRATAMRAAGMHFVWAWLAVGLWQTVPVTELALSRCEA